ncbi:MAG: EAL domain-containing protein [Burkholderiales bacterium]|nr:EAL domain-containing protein [Burkholderiales bacterium]
MAKILVVDDQAPNRELLVTLIGYTGHQALQASDGAEALAIVREQRPELVISDILMPTMDGYEFVRQLRADPLVAATEVIFYSAHYREREARNLAKSCGVTRVLVKPSEPEEILRVIEQSLQRVPEPIPPPDVAAFDREHLQVMTDKLSEKLDDLRATNRRLEALSALNLHLASEQDPYTLLDKVCRGARDLMGAKYAVLCVNGKNGGSPVFFTSGIDPSLLQTLERPHVDTGALGGVYSRRQSVRMDCLGGDPVAIGLPTNYPSLHSCLLAPVASISQCYGWICLADKLGALGFSEEDETMASTMMAQVGRIYENGSLYATVRQHAEQLQIEITQRQQAAEALQVSEERLHRAQILAKLSHVITGPQGVVESWPDTLPPLLGLKSEHMVDSARAWLALVHPDDRTLVRAKMLEADLTGARVDFTYRMRHSDGSVVHIRQVTEQLADSEAKSAPVRWFNTIQDVSYQKEAERRIQRLNRVYAVLSGINTLIVRVRTRDELFNGACQIAVEHGHFQMAWLGVADWDAMELIPVACAGAPPDFVAAMQNRFSLEERAPMATPISVRAVQGRRPVVINDMQEYAGSWYFRQSMDPSIRSLAYLPLMVSDKAVGVLVLSADETGFFDDEEKLLLTDLAGDIGFAMDHLDKEERLNYLAYYDVITGLPNRSLFLEHVSQHFRPHDSGKNALAIGLVDIERFRVINDTIGRQAGDALLRQVAERIRASSVGLETVARVGVNCFGVVVHDQRDEGAVALILEQLLRDCFAKPYLVDGAELRIAGKAGIALYPVDGNDAEMLLRNAEAALKRAKGSAESVLFYAPEMDTRVAKALDLESRLRTALELGQFVLYYQPKISLVNGLLTGAEALIRWNDPKTGLVPPANFIPLLEETGMIYEVGLWAMRQAIQDNMRWRAEGLTPVRIAVNVSPLQLRHRNFVAAVQQSISVDKNAAAGLELEITESLIMDNVQTNSESLRAIRALGVRIAIDDFGTGYSSLSHLSRLPVDTLKIDRSFVMEMVAGPQGLALVSTIVTLAHSFRLKVVAEGVETSEQERLLRLLGCDEMQGYLISKPVPADVFESRYLAQLASG